MCGRFTLSFFPEAEEQFESLFGISLPRPLYPPILGESILPFRDITVIHRTAENDLVSRPIFWNLVPAYSRSFDKQRTWFNIRREKLQQPYSKKLVKHQRCIVPVNAFFERQKSAGKPVYATQTVRGRNVRKQVSYAFRGREAPLMALGGVYDIWRHDGEALYSCSIITLPPNDIVGEVHPRMPFIVPKESIPIWLDSRFDDFDTLFDLIKPYPSEHLVRAREWPEESQRTELF